MATITVDAEVDMEDIDTSELCNELIFRLAKRNRQGISDEEKQKLKAALENEEEKKVLREKP